MTDPAELALTPVSVPFWEGAAQGDLVLQRCDSCQAFVWYPRAICPACHSAELTWTPAAGTGTVAFQGMEMPMTLLTRRPNKMRQELTMQASKLKLFMKNIWRQKAAAVLIFRETNFTGKSGILWL